MVSIDLEKNKVYTEDDIYNLIREKNNFISTQRLKWDLFELEKKGLISRIGTKKYMAGIAKYYYNLRNTSHNIDEFISNSFHDAKYTIWESVQLNEWINFMVNQNIIFVDIESELFEFIVDAIMEEFGKEYAVLVEPDEHTILRYMRNNLIIVNKLYSRSPISNKNHLILLEKLLVDLAFDKQYSQVFDTRTIEDVFQGIKQNYAINTTKLFNYAKRRGAIDKVEALWGE